MTPLEMPSRMARVVLAATLALAIPAAAWAQQPAETGWVQLAQSQVRLFGGANPSSPGERILLLEMTLQPNWKTYWRMPGDAGIPPSFDWTGSTNIGNAEVRYPAPAMYVDQAGRTIGYKTAVVFPIVLKPEDPSKPSSVRVELAFGICREICIPVETKVSLDIPPNAALASDKIADAMSKVPTRKIAKDAARGPVAVSAIELSGGTAAPKLSVKTAGVETLLVEAPDGLFVPIPQRVSGDEKSGRFEIDLAKSQDLPDLKGKILTITAIGKSGAVETVWTMPPSL